MTTPKLTKWYRVKEFYPKHSGWYDYRGMGIYQIRAFWNGKKWLWTPKGGGLHGLFPLRSDEWRGLARKPK